MDWLTSAILPSLIRMEPRSIVPCETVRIVAFRIRMTAAASGGFAALAGHGAGDGAVPVHGEVGGGLLGTIGRGVGKVPFTGEVAFRRLLGFLRLANFKPMAVDENHLDLRFFLEEITIGDD